MRDMTLNYLIDSQSNNIVPILKQNILVKPEVQGLGGLIEIPNTYDYEDDET